VLKLALGSLLLGSVLAAQQVSVDFDPAKTQIHWSLEGNVHTTHGAFRLKQGHVVLDAASGVISGDLVADATSGESGNSARDKRMHKDILESDRFPEFRFTPQKVEGAVSVGGHSTVRVSGVFQVHGAEHQVTIPVDVSFAGAEVTGTGKFSIPYVDWGMKDPSNFLFKVDKSVEVEVVAVGRVGSWQKGRAE
jgi:polyisoprenoid-binding protein YceI